MNHHPDKLEEMPNHMALAAAMSAAANGQGRFFYFKYNLNLLRPNNYSFC
jgi:hypothetical protein